MSERGFSEREITDHYRHMTDGRWHDDCPLCIRRRMYGGDGVFKSSPGHPMPPIRVEPTHD